MTGSLFTKRLNQLFEEKRHPNGEQYREAEVEVGTMQLGSRVTVSYLSRLRSGSSSNPTFEKIGVLAKFFDVSPNYFFREDEEPMPEQVSSARSEMAEIARRIQLVEDDEMRSLFLDMLRLLEDAEQVKV